MMVKQFKKLKIKIMALLSLKFGALEVIPHFQVKNNFLSSII